MKCMGRTSENIANLSSLILSSGIITLLHQDPSGGLEVLNADGVWIAAPYMPSSIVVNIGDLLARVSGGRFVATMHRVRVNGATNETNGLGRLSVPFFFEPGERCIIRDIYGGGSVVYGEHVRKKMATWVEFQDPPVERSTQPFGPGQPMPSIAACRDCSDPSR